MACCALYQSNYNIQALMDDIFTADWFYLPENIGTHIKSPVELLVGIRRAIPMQLQNEQIQILLQRTLGQMLFLSAQCGGMARRKNMDRQFFSHAAITYSPAYCAG